MSEELIGRCHRCGGALLLGHVCHGQLTEMQEQLTAACEAIRQLEANVAEARAEGAAHRSIVASLWEYLRERDAIVRRDGSDHDRILAGLGLLEARADKALALCHEGRDAQVIAAEAAREAVAGEVREKVGAILAEMGCACEAQDRDDVHTCDAGRIERILRTLPTPSAALQRVREQEAERALEGALEAVQVLGRTGVLGGHSINHVCDAIRALFPTHDAGGK